MVKKKKTKQIRRSIRLYDWFFYHRLFLLVFSSNRRKRKSFNGFVCNRGGKTIFAATSEENEVAVIGFSLFDSAMEKGVQRWVVDISTWVPSPEEFYSALSLLPSHHHSSITRFVKMEDRKRSFVSHLLQYTLLHELLGIPFYEIIINRTSEGKPYLEYDGVGLEFPNFNFNLSHHGDYVVIASEPLCLVGLDVVSYDIPSNETTHEFIKNFSSYFSSFEWENIITAGTSNDVLIEFYRYWCLKEAFVKAIGSGLSYRVDRVEFHHSRWTDITVRVEGEILKDWKFWGFEMGPGHWVCIARGHPKYACDSYNKTLKRTVFKEEEYDEGLHLPNPSFVSKTVEQLVSLLPKQHVSLLPKQHV